MGRGEFERSESNRAFENETSVNTFCQPTSRYKRAIFKPSNRDSLVPCITKRSRRICSIFCNSAKMIYLCIARPIKYTNYTKASRIARCTAYSTLEQPNLVTPNFYIYNIYIHIYISFFFFFSNEIKIKNRETSFQVSFYNFTLCIFDRDATVSSKNHNERIGNWSCYTWTNVTDF